MVKNYSGFTLIELMITLVIMSILLAVAAPNFQNWMDSSKMKSIAESMSSAVNLSRSHALKTNSLTNLAIDTSNSGDIWTISDFENNVLYKSEASSSIYKNINITVNQKSCSTKNGESFNGGILFNGLGNTLGYSSYDVTFVNTSNGSVTPMVLHISPSGDTFTCLLIDDVNNKNSCVFKQNRRGGQC